MRKNINVTRSFLPSLSEYIKEIKPIWDTAWLTNMGPIHNKFEDEVKQYLKTEYISLFSNGHLALESAIQSLGLTGEIITTPFTFASTTHAIARSGLKPVFCDINYDNYTIDTSKIEALITDKTTAIIPVHVYGNICNINDIQAIAKKYNLKVIYDSAHVFGVEVGERGIGSFGDISMFSFHSTKVFHTIEGGALCYKDPNLTPILNHKKNFGIDSPESVVDIGSNAKMNEFQAAMGLVNLRYINEQIEKRKKVVERYRHNLDGLNGIKICNDVDGVKHNYAYFPVVFDEKMFGKTRDEVCENLQIHNIFARKYFYPLTSDFECYKNLYNSADTPVAKYISERVLTLPLYADLELEDVDRICNIIKGMK